VVKYIRNWVVKNSANDFDNAMTLALKGTQLGTGSTTICTVTTTVATTDSCSGYTDNNTAVTYAQYLTSPPANTQWQNAAGAASTGSTIITGGNTETTVSYYSQLTNTYEISPLGGSTAKWSAGLSLLIKGTYLGTGSSTICTINPSSGVTTPATCTAYADYNLAITWAQYLTGAASETQWQNSAGAASTHTFTTSGNTQNSNYYIQVQNT